MIHRERRNYLECEIHSREEDEQYLLSYVDHLRAILDNPQKIDDITDEEFDRAVDLMREHPDWTLFRDLARATSNFHNDY